MDGLAIIPSVPVELGRVLDPATDQDLAHMLRELGDAGWKPVLYFDDWCMPRRCSEVPPPPGWIAYPQADVRSWRSFRAPDPLGAVRGLYLHAVEHPNVPPAPPAPEAPRREETRPDDARPGVQVPGCVLELVAPIAGPGPENDDEPSIAWLTSLAARLLSWRRLRHAW